MARSVETIYADLIAKKEADSRLDTLTTSSKTSIWGLFLYIIAYGAWLLETMFDTHKSEVTEILTELKPHTARWYRNKALAFQRGFALIADTDVYDNSAAEDDVIENSKIIKYAAVTEAVTESRLIIKIATENETGILSPIDPADKISFDAYIDRVRDAGVRITTINYPPDVLRLEIDIYYDPLILNADGMKIKEGIGSGTFPVQLALQEFMKELPFNGELSVNALVDKLQKTEGVIEPHLKLAASKWLASDGTEGIFENIAVTKIPVSGYFKIENFDNIKYYAK